MQLHLLLTASLWSVLFWRKDGISSAAEPGYLDFDNLPETNFSCEAKVIGGYYADVETGCQMFHVCTIGQKGEITDIKFLCLNGTVFDQETRVCERLDEVDCSRTESFFDLNLELYGNKGHGFGIEPENEEVIEEECDPDEDEECLKTEDEDVSIGGIQQTTYTPISSTTMSPKRPNPFSPSTQRAPTTTVHPITTNPSPISVQFPSNSPDTIAALLALHNAFTQSLQHHDISNKQKQQQQQLQQQHQIEQQQKHIQQQQQKLQQQQIQQQKQQQQLQEQQQKQQQQQQQQLEEQQQVHNHQQQTQQHSKQSAIYSQLHHPSKPSSFQPPPTSTQTGHRFPIQAQQNFEPSKTSVHSSAVIQSERFGNPYVHQQHFPVQNFPHHHHHRQQPPPLPPPPPPPPQPQPPQSDRSKPFAFHQQFEPQSTASPYLLHQLKVNRVKHEQHSNFPRQAQRSLTTPAIAVVTSTSTTTSVRSGQGGAGKGQTTQQQIQADRTASFQNGSPFIQGDLLSGTDPANSTLPTSYDEYQESDVQTDPFFRDVPKIGRLRRNAPENRQKIRNRRLSSSENSSENNRNGKTTLKVIKSKKLKHVNLNKLQKKTTNISRSSKFPRRIIKRDATDKSGSNNNNKIVRKIRKKTIKKKIPKNDVQQRNQKMHKDAETPEEEEFSEIIENIQKTVSAKVVSTRKPNIYQNSRQLKDNLELSPEERKFFSEVSAVMSKYIPPESGATNSSITVTADASPNLSARDKHRLSLFVTSNGKQKTKNKVRKRRQVTEKTKRRQNNYEVSETIDEPTTEIPSARRLIGRYRSNTNIIRPSINITDFDNGNVVRRKSYRTQTDVSTQSSVNRIVSPQRNFERFEASQQEPQNRESLNPQLLSSARHRMLVTNRNKERIPPDDSVQIQQPVVSRRRLPILTSRPSSDAQTQSLKTSLEDNNAQTQVSLRRNLSNSRNSENKKSYEVKEETPLLSSSSSFLQRSKQKASVDDIVTTTKISTINNEDEIKISSPATPKEDEPKKSFVPNIDETQLADSLQNPTEHKRRLSVEQESTTFRNHHHYHHHLENPLESTLPLPTVLPPGNRLRKTVRRRPVTVSSSAENLNPTAPLETEFKSRRRPSGTSREVSSTETTSSIIPEFKSRRRPATTISDRATTSLESTTTTNIVDRKSSRRRTSVGRTTPKDDSLSETVPSVERNSRRRRPPPNKENSSVNLPSTTVEPEGSTPVWIPPEVQGNFSCEEKVKGGFYADIEADCRGFFICSQGEINGPLLKSHFWCGQATRFNQRSRTCQADYLVECSISPRYFSLNNDFLVPTLEEDTFEPKKI